MECPASMTTKPVGKMNFNFSNFNLKFVLAALTSGIFLCKIQACIYQDKLLC